eukprot:12896968-Prorocentrum_lima.AAC.1
MDLAARVLQQSVDLWSKAMASPPSSAGIKLARNCEKQLRKNLFIHKQVPVALGHRATESKTRAI